MLSPPSNSKLLPMLARGLDVLYRRFTGTAGTAVITTEKALLWTDGRYFLQVCGEAEV